MDIAQLENFQAIAKLEHLTKAAEHLNISQPALSVSLAKLESELGVSLFDRVGRRISLNECGHIFLEYVNLILHDVENAKIEMSDYIEKTNKVITFYYISKRNMEPLYYAYSQEHPDVTIRKFEITAFDIDKSLRGSECDFVVYSGCNIEDYNCNYEIVAEEPLYVALSANHPLAKRERIDIEELKDESIVTMPPGFSLRIVAERLCANAGFECKVSHECFLCQLLGNVAKGVGITFVSDSMLNESCNTDFLSDKLCFIPLNGEHTTIKTALLWSPDRKLTKESKSFLSSVRKQTDNKK